MRIKDGYVLREVAGMNVIIPIGERVIDFKGMLMPNASGVFLWKALQADAAYDALLAAMLEKYEVDEATAKADLDDFLAEVRSVGALVD